MFISKDAKHQQSKNFLVEHSKSRLLCSDNVILEVLNWLSKKVAPHKTSEIGHKLLDESIAKIVPLEKSDKEIALTIIKKFKDQQLSYVDATSFALIQRLNLKQIFSYDSDFNLLKNIENLALQN